MAAVAPPSVWEDIRRAYVAGAKPKRIVASEELRRACAKFGVTAKAISDKACRERWRAERDETRRIVEESRPVEVAAAVVDEAVDATRRQLAVLARGLDKADEMLAECRNPVQFSAWCTGIKALVQSQRLALGLGNPPPASGKGAVDADADGPPTRFVVQDPGPDA